MPLVLRSSPRFILATTRMIALVGYRKKERRWEKVERQKIEAENQARGLLGEQILMTIIFF